MTTETHHEFPRYRRLRDGAILDAVRYGNSDGSWDEDAVTRVAKFVLGIDVETRMNAANESMLDVVRPDLKRWNLEKGIADVEVIDTTTGMAQRLRLGDWVVRDEKGNFIYVESNAFDRDYTVPADFNDLSDFIFEYFPWKDQAARSVAETISAKLIWAGWSRTHAKKTAP